LKKNGIVESYQRDNNDEVVVTKLNRASLETIAKSDKGLSME
jgi:Ca-activated chloride channel family protein